jgi:hypothetical protein
VSRPKTRRPASAGELLRTLAGIGVRANLDSLVVSEGLQV